MKPGTRFIKIVEWSDEGQFFIGQCPGVIGPCCHGDDEAQVYLGFARLWTNGLTRCKPTASRCRNQPSGLILAGRSRA